MNGLRLAMESVVWYRRVMNLGRGLYSQGSKYFLPLVKSCCTGEA
jgi:hypothetical protein